MTRPNKRKQAIKKMVQDRERHKIRKVEENGTIDTQWESSPEVEEPDVIPIGLIPMSAESESDDSDDDEVIVSEDEELEQPDEPAFERLMASAMHESKCVYSP